VPREQLSPAALGVHRAGLLAYEPPPERMPYEWADAQRTQPSGRAEPGPWRSSRTPYTKAFQAAAIDTRTRRAFLVMCSQGGKSASFLSIGGHRLQDDPAPIMTIVPTRDLAVKVVEPKIDDLIRSTPALGAVTQWGQRYTTTLKWINGVPWRLAWGGKSTSQTKADDACIVQVDELDEFPADINGQGDIVHLADARHNSYPDGRTLGTSTPSEGAIETYQHPVTGLEHWLPAKPEHVPSLAWRWWQACSRHEWAWPCPSCAEYFIPRRSLLWAPWDGTLDEIEAQARLTCSRCGDMIATRHRSSMNARGVMVAPGQGVKPYEAGDELAVIIDREGQTRAIPFGLYYHEGAGKTDFSFHASGLATWSTKLTFGALARLAAESERSGDPNELKSVTNTQFGECFSFGGEAPVWEMVAARKTGYLQGEVPAEVGLLLGAVDVQGDRFEWNVRGWGAREESWLIEHGQLWGDTATQKAWDDLHEWTEQTWGGRGLAQIAIDSGFRRDQVYGFCQRDRRRLLPTKGHDALDQPFYRRDVQVNSRGKKAPWSVRLWHIDTDRMKTWIHARMSLSPDAPGQWHLPGDISPDYCRQIVSEQRTFEGGKISWKVRGENHQLDCEVLQVFLARKERMAIARASRRRARAQAAAEPGKTATATAEPPAQRALKRRPRRGNWTTSHRL